MRIRSARTASLAALSVAAMLLAACASAGTTQAPLPSPTTTAAPVPTATPASLEGRFGYEQMQSFLNTVQPMVAQFFQEQFPNLRRPGGVNYVARGRLAASPCGRHDSGAYEYCPADAGIYIGQDLLWSFFRVGDAAPVIGLAHEWGHHLQSMRRLPSPRTLAQSVAYENQADCISGAWTKYAGEKGWLELPDDLDDVAGLLRAIGSREGSRRDHGTAAERRDAFELGRRDGLKGCNSYVPGAPLV